MSRGPAVKKSMAVSRRSGLCVNKYSISITCVPDGMCCKPHKTVLQPLSALESMLSSQQVSFQSIRVEVLPLWLQSV